MPFDVKREMGHVNQASIIMLKKLNRDNSGFPCCPSWVMVMSLSLLLSKMLCMSILGSLDSS